MEIKTHKIEHYEKRFGVIAKEKGFITLDDLIKALTIQVKEDIEKGKHRLIGEILCDKDVMSPTQVEDVLKVLFQQKDRLS